MRLTQGLMHKGRRYRQILEDVQELEVTLLLFANLAGDIWPDVAEKAGDGAGELLDFKAGWWLDGSTRLNDAAVGELLELAFPFALLLGQCVGPVDTPVGGS